MEKTKLINKRKERGFSQDEISSRLNMSKSSYYRREKGEIPISEKQWGELADILDCSREDIFEREVASINIGENNGNVFNLHAQQHIYHFPKEAWDCIYKYIQILESKSSDEQKSE